MRFARELGLGFLFAMLPSLLWAERTGETPAPFEFVRIVAETTGASRFEDGQSTYDLVEFSESLPPVSATAPITVTKMIVISVPAGGVTDWHPVPRRQVNIILSGKIEIEVSNGEVRRFGPGSWIVGEDTTGQGHITRVVSDSPVRFVVIGLAAQ